MNGLRKNGTFIMINKTDKIKLKKRKIKVMKFKRQCMRNYMDVVEAKMDRRYIQWF